MPFTFVAHYTADDRIRVAIHAGDSHGEMRFTVADWMHFGLKFCGGGEPRYYGSFPDVYRLPSVHESEQAEGRA